MIIVFFGKSSCILEINTDIFVDKFICAFSFLIKDSTYQFSSVQSLSCVHVFATPQTAACQAPLFMDFSRQEYWSGLPFPTLGDLPDPGMEPASLTFPTLAGIFITTTQKDSKIFYPVCSAFLCYFPLKMHLLK